MTTSNPPTAVEALRLALPILEDDLASFEHDTPPALFEKRGFVCLDDLHCDIHRYRECEQIMAALAAVRQALQLHGGGESRSDFASGSGDKVPETPVQPGEFGWAPGSYLIHCMDCRGDGFDNEAKGWCDKRALRCRACAQKIKDARVHQALSGGGEATPKSETNYTAILQGPTREDVARIIDSWAWREPLKTMTEAFVRRLDSLHRADAILALLNPTSPWRDIESAPKNGSDILTYRATGLAAVATWCGPRLGWCVTDGACLVDVTHWMPLPALPGGSE